jgi:hypothetical protein
MRTLLALVLLAAASYGVVVIAELLFDYQAGRAPGAHPIRLPPWYVMTGLLSATALLGWLGIRLRKRGTLGRMVRGRGISPAER